MLHCCERITRRDEERCIAGAQYRHHQGLVGERVDGSNDSDHCALCRVDETTELPRVGVNGLSEVSIIDFLQVSRALFLFEDCPYMISALHHVMIDDLGHRRRAIESGRDPGGRPLTMLDCKSVSRQARNCCHGRRCSFRGGEGKDSKQQTGG